MGKLRSNFHPNTCDDGWGARGSEWGEEAEGRGVGGWKKEKEGRGEDQGQEEREGRLAEKFMLKQERAFREWRAARGDEGDRLN